LEKLIETQSVKCKRFFIKRIGIKIMSIVLWLVYVLLVVCTSVVSVMAVLQRRPKDLQTSVEAPLIDSTAPEPTDHADARKPKEPEKDAGAPKPPDSANDTDQKKHTDDAGQPDGTGDVKKKDAADAAVHEGETMTSGWV
jgi:hypothetical protein